MKYVAWFLTAVAVIALLVTGYVFWAADPSITVQGYHVESAADRKDAFDNILNAVKGGSDSLMIYNDELNSTPEQYVFVTYSFEISNRDLVGLEWLDLTVDNKPGDMLMAKPTVVDIPAFKKSTVSFVLMMDRSTADYVRTAHLSYYIYGHEKDCDILFN